MKRFLSLFMVVLFSMMVIPGQVFAADDDDLVDRPIVKSSDLKRPIVDMDKNNNIKTNAITLRSVGAGALSLIVWPGLGQMVNNNNADKVITHAVFGLFPLYRIWSGYDALVAREGGYWEGRI